MTHRQSFTVAALLLLGFSFSSCKVQAPPMAKSVATNFYHGVPVPDSFQWLERKSDPASQEWSMAQAERSRAYFDKLPERPWIEDRLERLLSIPSTNYYSLTIRPGRLFFLKSVFLAQPSMLVSVTAITNLKSEIVVLDPGRLIPKHDWSIDWYVPSPDGKTVAVSLSEDRNLPSDLHLYEAATGRALPEQLPRVQTPGSAGSAVWTPDGAGFYYTRYSATAANAAEARKPRAQIHFHKLGTPPESDRVETQPGQLMAGSTQLKISADGRFLLASVGTGVGQFVHYLRTSNAGWQEIARAEDQIRQIEFGRDPLYIEWPKDDALYLLSRDHAPKGKILRLPISASEVTNAYTLIGEGPSVIKEIMPSASGLCVVYGKGAPSDFGFLDYYDGTNRIVQSKSPSTVEEIAVGPADEILFRVESYLEPSAWWHYNPNRHRDTIELTTLLAKSPADFGDVEAVRESVKSRDGTKVPLTILRRKGTRMDGSNPTVLTGFGSYGTNLVPEFELSRRLWLDQGGLLAIANLRGGDEFGDAWRAAGIGLNKTNAFEDLTACAEFLIRSNYTRPSRLAVEAEGAGGLPAAALLARRPELIGAAVLDAGLYDLLRPGPGVDPAAFASEFGSLETRAKFNALYGFSPYYQLRPGTNYPAVLMFPDRTDGGPSRRMLAQLQRAAGPGGNPLFLRSAGSKSSLKQHIRQLADTYAFLFHQLGIDYSLIDRGPWSGALTPTTARVKARVARENLNVRLLVSDNPGFSRPLFFGPVRSETNHYAIVEFEARQLQPRTQYYYALEINGRIDRRKRGEFQTLPQPGPASFKIAFASCAKTGSTSDIFDRIRENHPLFFMNMGDFHYLDIQTNSRTRFRAAYDSVLASPQQAELYRNIPFVYVWDDHDFGGNNSNRKASSHEAARLTYEEYVPHYPLALGEGDIPIYQSFSVGRVKFILTDLRSERDDPKKKDDANKTMMGAKQKEWFKNELLAANGRYPLICWVSSVPWIGKGGTNVYRLVQTNQFGYIHHTNLFEPRGRPQRIRPPLEEDYWGVFTTERREIADFIKSNHISGVCILHGDAHMLGADDGRNSDYATDGGARIPVLAAAPLDQEPSIKGGPYSQGVYRMHKGEGGFGLLTVDDRGSVIDVAYSGRNNKNEEKISLHFTVPATNQPPAGQ